MKRFYLPLILLLILVLEGVALELLPVSLLKTDLLIVSHWVFVFLVFIAVFYDNDRTHFSVLYALIFGLLIDMVYTNLLGVYMFSYACTIYLIYGLKKLLHGNILVVALLGVVGLVVSDMLIYLIYTVVGITDTAWSDYFTSRLLPTVGSNLVFLLLLYPFFAKKLTDWGKDQITKGNTF
ncbi:rod shape-determining protein MreD [Virgibacillus pantothenticus]|uniref:rod shape-determining protein MreD n=1 Tax=Virgibacillus pantothenticus TaxID=1473 RepID=UPI003D269320